MATLPPGAQITPPRVPLIDPRTGQIDRAWYLFFYNLFRGSSSNTDVIGSVLVAPTQTPTGDIETAMQSLQTTLASLSTDVDQIRSIAEIAQLAPPDSDFPQSAASVPPSTITVTGSPFSYQNTTTFRADVIVQGGTVSKVEFSRDGSTWYDVGVTAGMFGLSPSDRLRVTYTGAPTMTLIPR